MTSTVNESHVIARFISLAISIASNSFLLAFIIYKVFLKHEKEISKIFQFLLVYISGTILVMLYNIIYRFSIQNSIHDCTISDTIEESLIAILRTTLLLYYILMVHTFFKEYKKTMYITSVSVIIIHLLILPSIYISYMEPLPIPSVNNKFGVYCRQNWDSGPAYISVILYQTFDCLFTLLVLIVIVWKMYNLYVVLDKDSIMLIAIVKKALVLCSISIVSSWVLVFSGRLSVSSPLRWISPLDLAINAWCLFLWFDWKEFGFCNFKRKEVYLKPVGSGVLGNGNMVGVNSDVGDGDV